MRSRRPTLAALAFLSAATALAASSPEDPLALSNWSAPPYWVPSVEESRRTDAKHVRAAAVANPSLAFHAVTPCRIADTRGFGFTGPYGPPNLTAGSTRSFAVTSPGTSCGIPSGVAAVSFNFAVVNLAASGNLVVSPTGAPAPAVSSLNWTPSELAISNAAVIALGADSINVLVNGPASSTVDLVIDVNGFYAADPVPTLSGDVTGPPTATVVGSVGGSTASSLHAAEQVANAATSANTASAIVRRNASGDIAVGKVAAAGGYTQPGSGGETLRTIRGTVANNGTPFQGTGFTSTKNSTGNYTVTFSTPFSAVTSVTATAFSSQPVLCSITLQGAAFVTIQTFNLAGTPTDFSFTFVAVGPS